MSFQEKWNSPANKAALVGLPFGLVISGILNGGLAAIGGQPNIWSVLIVAAIAWGASTAVVLRRNADIAVARRP